MLYTFSFAGEINARSLVDFINFVNSIENIAPDDALTININSPGGSVSDSVAIYNIIKKLPCNVITHNLGEVSSAAILLYMSGKTRTAEDISKFVFHPPIRSLNGNHNYYQLKEVLENLTTDINNYCSIVTATIPTITEKYDILKSLTCEALVLTKNDAVACGIVTIL